MAKDGERSRSVGNKEHVVPGVKIYIARVCRRIADGPDMACIRIDGDNFVILAHGEKLTAGAIHGESCWAGAGSKLP